jgi:hypothetical protein
MKRPLWLIRDKLNAARDRRQAMMRAAKCIDTQSEPGSWAEALRYVQFPVVEYDDWWETRHERRAARRQSVAVLAAKKGHSTRWANAGKRARAMFG